MKVYACILCLLFSTLSYGAFPVKRVFVPPNEANASGINQGQNVEAPSGFWRSLVQRPHFFVQKGNAADEGVKKKHGNNGLSILSFCLALASNFIFDAWGIAPVLVIFFGATMAIAALVIGILALTKRQKLRGLAITGIVLGTFGIATALLTALLFAVL